MSETQKEYKKTITFTDLAQYIFGTYCIPKIMRDIAKPDPMTESLIDLDILFDEESTEKALARIVWKRKKTDETANAYLEEIADQINILLFEAGKIAGYEKMRRE